MLVLKKFNVYGICIKNNYQQNYQYLLYFYILNSLNYIKLVCYQVNLKYYYKIYNKKGFINLVQNY